MKRILFLTAVLALVMTVFVALANAAIEQCDFSDPRDGDVDARDLSQFIDYYATGNLLADVDESGTVDAD